jgi:hypothetical protein
MGYEQRGYDAPPNVGPHDDAPRGFAQPYDQHPFERGYGYDRHHGFGPGPFWPFFLIGGLIKFLLFALLAGLLLRFLFKKNGWSGPWRGGPPWGGGGGGGRPDQPDKPGPEPQQQTYTGETRSL